MALADDSQTTGGATMLEDSQEWRDVQSCRLQLQNIISADTCCGDFQQEIHQLLGRLCAVNFFSDAQLVASLPDLQMLWQISRHNTLSNLRAVLADLISQDEHVQLFQNLLRRMLDCGVNVDGQSSEFWKSLKTVLCVLWNCSDISPKLCKSISDCGVLVTLLHLLAQVIKTSDFVLDEKKHFLVKAFLGILHNAVRNCADCKGILLETGTMHILPQLFTAASPMVKAKSLMVASYLVNEKENEVLNSSDDTISFIVQVLADSTKSKNHTSSKYGMNCLEIMKGLNNIAMNDANKVKIVSAGGLKLFAMLLVSENQEEQELSALSVWTLAFASPVKGRIIQEPGLVEGLYYKGKY